MTQSFYPKPNEPQRQKVYHHRTYASIEDSDQNAHIDLNLRWTHMSDDILSDVVKIAGITVHLTCRLYFISFRIIEPILVF